MPKVDSMVVSVDFEKPYPKRAVHEGFFRKVVKGAFAHRRKTILNSLKGAMPDQTRESLLNALAACGIESGKRAEVLEMGIFCGFHRRCQLTTGYRNDKLQNFSLEP